ncbi:MAG TPA: aminoacyl-tRNA hydrolase [Atopostipes sp.]|nr:aminoacyl-tRNA hydrolase [Atopostipes sp.]
MKLIFGLGNPGTKYQNTKHNIGFIAVDRIAENLGLTFNQTKFKSLYAEGRIGTEKIVLIKPQTFMNLSGESVQPWMDYYNLTGEDIVIIYDDMDLPVGKIRLRAKGGHGGHNGMKSIIQHLGTKEFNRIRVGVGRPSPRQTVVSHVLSRFPTEEIDDMKEAVQAVEDAIKHWGHDHTFLETMNEFN